MSDISSKKEQLGISDLEELKKKYEQVCRELEENREECGRISGLLEEKLAEKQGVADQINTISEEMGMVQAEINSQTEELERTRKQHDEISARQKDIIAAHNNLLEDLNKLKSSQQDIAMKRCENELEVMQEAVDKLFPEVSFAALTLFDQRDLMEKKGRYFKEEIQRIRNLLDHYRREYQTVIAAVEGGISKYEM